jgi:uncharacterized membrane protein (DUF106 family)
MENNNNNNNKKSIFKRIALLGSAALVTSAPMLALAPGAIAAITLGTVAGTAVIVKVVRNHKKAVNTKQSRKQAKLEVREEQKLNKKDLHKKMKSLKMEIKDHKKEMKKLPKDSIPAARHEAAISELKKALVNTKHDLKNA